MMKNKLLSIVVSVLLATTIVGCGAETPADFQPEENIASEQEESDSGEPGNESEDSESDAAKSETEETSEQEMSEAETAESETAEQNPAGTEESRDFTFADMAERTYAFSSGAGGWAEEFAIEKDGFFTGSYHDSDMGDMGEDYTDGTVYSSSYSGHFTNLTPVNEYTYTMELADISYKDEADTTEIRDNTRYIYTKSYCLGGTDTFTVYLPGTPVSELSEDIRMWLSAHTQLEEELTMIAIVDEKNAYGIASYDRPEPLEDARMMYDNCKGSYDYYGERASEANSTAEMVEYSSAMYEISDECLNYIWNLVRYNVEETRYNEILAEQKAWIAQKEAKGEEVRQEYQMGTLGPVIYNDELASLTMERCQELIGYLEE